MPRVNQINAGPYAALSGSITIDLWGNDALSDLFGNNDVGKTLTFRAAMTATGALTGTVSLYQGSLIGSAVVYDSAPCGGIDLAGTDAAGDSVTVDAVGSRFWRVEWTTTGTDAEIAFTVEAAE